MPSYWEYYRNSYRKLTNYADPGCNIQLQNDTIHVYMNKSQCSCSCLQADADVVAFVHNFACAMEITKTVMSKILVPPNAYTEEARRSIIGGWSWEDRA